MLPLLLAALLSQTVYEWTDAKGGVHYTDDRASIPSNAKKVRTTAGEEVTVMKLTPTPTTSAEPATPTRNTCDELKAKVASLETQRDALFKAYEARLSEAQAQCRSQLATHGQGAYAQCVSSTAARAGAAPDDSSLKKDIDDAKEALRRAQVGGCR
jgi:hypothetical protein